MISKCNVVNECGEIEFPSFQLHSIVFIYHLTPTNDATSELCRILFRTINTQAITLRLASMQQREPSAIFPFSQNTLHFLSMNYYDSFIRLLQCRRRALLLQASDCTHHFLLLSHIALQYDAEGIQLA